MKRITRKAGAIVYWLGWPFFLVYFLFGQRTRVLLVRGDEVLVVSGLLSDGRWSMPGGGLHRGENPLTGMLRELQEEVGATIPEEQVKTLYTRAYASHGHRYVYTQFLAEVEGDLPLKLQKYEIAEAAWVHYSKLNRTNARSDVLLAIQAWRTGHVPEHQG